MPKFGNGNGHGHGQCMNCHELSCLDRKLFLTFFLVRVPPCGQHRLKIFYQPDMTIYAPIESPCQV